MVPGHLQPQPAIHTVSHPELKPRLLFPISHLELSVKNGVCFFTEEEEMKRAFAFVSVFALTSSLAFADCRWCSHCNTWHCDSNQPVVSQPVTQANRPTVQPGDVQAAQVVQQPVYGQSSYASEVLRLTNSHRARYGLSPLSMSQNMGAQNHAQQMSSRRSMFHSGGFAENVGYGNMSPSQVVNMWMNSPGHRRNILGPYRQLDVGKSGNGWVQRFR
jgi:hypothetical protein